MKEYPGIKFVEMGRVLGERWRALLPNQKVKFEGMAAQDKVRFQTEMQLYTTPSPTPESPLTVQEPVYDYPEPELHYADAQDPYDYVVPEVHSYH